MTPRLVKLLWTDAAFEMDAQATLATVATIGWLVAETSIEVVVASELIDNKTYRAYTAVPTANVIEVIDIDTD